MFAKFCHVVGRSARARRQDDFQLQVQRASRNNLLGALDSIVEIHQPESPFELNAFQRAPI